MNLKPGEGAAIANLFKNPDKAFDSDVTVNGVDYIVVEANDSLIRGVRHSTGVIIAKTVQTIIISLYPSYIDLSRAERAVSFVAENLRENGY